jgi:hypothetical protein
MNIGKVVSVILTVVSWVVTIMSSCGYRGFRKIYCIHLQGGNPFYPENFLRNVHLSSILKIFLRNLQFPSTLKMEAVPSSETLTIL